MDWTISREYARLWDLSYSFGAYLGDGWTSFVPHKNGTYFQTGVCCMDPEIVEKWKGQVKSVFGRDYAITTQTLKSGTVMYSCSAKCTEVAHTFWVNTAHREEIPEAFINAPKKVVQELVAGLMDTDGSVSMAECWNGNKTAKNVRYQLKFGLTSRKIVESLAMLLQRHGVLVGAIGEETKGGYKTIYRIQPNLRSFVDAGFYFCCKRKEARVKAYLGLVASETLYADAPTRA